MMRPEKLFGVKVTNLSTPNHLQGKGLSLDIAQQGPQRYINTLLTFKFVSREELLVIRVETEGKLLGLKIFVVHGESEETQLLLETRIYLRILL